MENTATTLSKEKITKNATKFFQTGEKYKFLTDSLIEFLGPEFISAPASTSTQQYGSFEGGLIAHTLLVTKYAVSLNEILPEKQKVKTDTLIKVCCLHQIGKVRLFKPLVSDWHNKRGIMYEFNETLTSMRVSERSIHYIISHGVTLTEEEYAAILNFDKPDDDLQSKYHNSMLGDILKIANILAIKEEKAI